MVRVESVGAKVGSDLRRKGFAAVIIATIFMGVYIAIQFRHVSWSFGAGAVIALIHDVLVVICALVISPVPIRSDHARRGADRYRLLGA